MLGLICRWMHGWMCQIIYSLTLPEYDRTLSCPEKLLKLMNLVLSTPPQVSEVTTKLRHSQPYWVSLPNVLCSDRVATGTGAEDKCWNGMTRAR